MIHSFSVTERKNYNKVVEFFQDNKLRRIIFTKDSEAYVDFNRLSFNKENTPKDIVIRMKKKYFFKANANNKSIFRPVIK